MALTVAASDINIAGSASSVAVSLTVTAGRSVVLFAIAIFGPEAGTITFASDRSESVTVDAVDSLAQTAIAHIVSAVGGATEFTASWTGGTSGRVIIVAAELSGTIGSVADADHRSDGNIGATPYGLTLTTATDDLVMASALSLGGLSTINNSFAELEGRHDFGDGFVISKVAAGASESPSYTSNSDASAGMSAAAYREGVAATRDQEGARFGADDGNEAAHTWLAAQDASVTHPLGTNLLLRALVDATDDPASTAYTLRAQKNGSGGYVAVPVGSTVVSAGTYFGGASGGTNPTTGTTITIPASLPTTCVLCLHFTSRDHTSGTGQPTVTDNNSGAAWTQQDFSTDRKAQFWWKRYEANLSSKTITIAGAVGSCTARLVVLENVYATGDPFTNLLGETNASGNETHAAITPTYPGSAVVFAVHNYANDNAVTSVSAATTGAPGQSTGHLSTGGSDCGTHVAVWNNHPASTTGAFTWAQTNGTTYSRAYAVRPLETPNELYVAPSANITAGGEATTARLTAPSGKTTSDFTTGRRWDDENGSDSLDIAADFYTEVEWCLRAQAPAVNTDYWDFRVYAGADPLDTYGVTPRWTLGDAVRLPARLRLHQAVQRAAVH